ncbi:MAG TPA: hypothetical protein VF170_19030 [Planctomycetaceae bacterium]
MNDLSPWDWLNLIAGVASVVGLLVSLYTLYKVETLPAAIRRHTRDQQLSSLIDDFMAKPRKSKLTDTAVREVRQIVKFSRMFYVRPLPWQDRAVRRILAEIEQELDGGRYTENVQTHLRFLRNELTIR